MGQIGTSEKAPLKTPTYKKEDARHPESPGHPDKLFGKPDSAWRNSALTEESRLLMKVRLKSNDSHRQRKPKTDDNRGKKDPQNHLAFDDCEDEC